MKKFTVVIWIVALVLIMFTGCGNNERENETNTGKNGARGLISVISREDGSGTRGAFVELLGIEQRDGEGNKVDRTTVEAIIANSTEFVMSNVAGDPNAIGYISMGSLNSRVKALRINGVEATADNIKKGEYVVSRPFNIAFRETSDKATRDFLDFILSKEGQAVVEKMGYIRAVEETKAYIGTGVEGKIVVAGSSSVSPVMEKLIEAYKEINTNVEIELQTSDSTTGLQAVLDGTADIGMASRELKESESSLMATVMAIDGIVVIVNPQNTIDTLTVPEVRAIFTGGTIIW